MSGDRQKGFTLVELLVVIIIIGILAAIAIPAFLNQRQKGYDAQVVSDVRSTAAAVLNEDEGAGVARPWTVAGKNSLYVDGNSGLLPAGSTLWSSIPGTESVSATDGVLIEMVHISGNHATWTNGHEPMDFCLMARSSKSKYDYAGGNPLLYGDMTYYDQRLGGVTDFKRIVKAFQDGEPSSCYGYAKRFLEVGGTI